ncbi:MAG: porin family protein [Bacteroidota bacterium]|nr:porin family protein [Bacteroidota bacterium]
MKKLAIVIVIIFAASFANAQISFGPKIGYNTSKLSVDKSDIKTDLKNSFQFGLFLRLGSKIYFQPEVNWLTQGGVFKKPGSEGNLSPFKQEIEMKTVQVPALVGYKLLNLKVANIRAFAGPVASFVTNKKIDSDDSQGYIEPIEQADLKDIIWSAQIGVGADVLMFTLDIRYNIGLSKVIGDIEYEDETITFDSRASGFNVSLGWKIL